MRPSKRLLPRLEMMESKALMSAMGAGSIAVPTIVSASTAGHKMRLIGVINGQYASPMSNPDAGAHYDLTGSGLIRPLGHTTIGGGVGTVGFIRGGHAGGTLTLVQSRGSVSLALTGPHQDGPAKLPYQYRFSISGGTGAFQGAKGAGTALLVLNTTGGRSGVGSYDLTLLGDLVKKH